MASTFLSTGEGVGGVTPPLVANPSKLPTLARTHYA